MQPLSYSWTLYDNNYVSKIFFSSERFDIRLYLACEISPKLLRETSNIFKNAFICHFDCLHVFAFITHAWPFRMLFISF